jgi:hypothetical protein
MKTECLLLLTIGWAGSMYGQNSHPSGQDSSVRATKPDRRSNLRLANRPGQSSNYGRHRGPNPATIGGLGNSTAGSTGSINGTRLHRRL